MKKKLLIAMFIMLMGAFAYMLFIYNPCKEPAEFQITAARLICVTEFFSTDVKQSRKDACLSIKGTEDCTFTEADKKNIEQYLAQWELTCVKKELSKRNLCVDRLGALR